MRIPRIYIEQDLADNQELQVDDSTYRYLSTVLRMKVGRQMVLFNGDGYEYQAVINDITKKALRVQVQSVSKPQVESPLSLELGCCLIKNDKMDWLLQKATELGVASITPLYSEYTDAKIPQERIEKKMQHWQKVSISASEQSGRVAIPAINKPLAISQWIENAKADVSVVLHPYDSQSISSLFKSPSLSDAKSCVLLVGPEGGLSGGEVEHALRKGFLGLSLGPRILRAETAPLTALAIIQALIGDL